MADPARTDVDQLIAELRDEWLADGVTCSICGGPAFAWLCDDATWAETEHLLGQAQVCAVCFIAARHVVRLDAEPVRIIPAASLTVERDVWRSGEPPKHGYYIGVFRRGGGLIVSELWFNPDANPRWWFARGYTGLDMRKGQHYAVRSEVVSWMPFPEPPVMV